MQTSKKDIIKFQKNLNKSLSGLDEVINKEGWVFNYDEESDILYFSKKNEVASANSILIPINDSCIVIRVSRVGTIEAFTIENFGSVFVYENPEFKSLYQALTEAKSNTVNISRYKLQYKSFLSYSIPLINSFSAACA
jgi:uncharacterized protein YuzE